MDRTKQRRHRHVTLRRSHFLVIWISIISFWTLQTEDKAFSPLPNGNTGPLHYNKEQMCSKCVCPDTHYRRVCTLSVCLCCRSISLCGCYRSHLSLALCFIPFLPHQIADRFYSCSVPGGTPPLPDPPAHTHTHTRHTFHVCLFFHQSEHASAEMRILTQIEIK